MLIAHPIPRVPPVTNATRAMGVSPCGVPSLDPVVARCPGKHRPPVSGHVAVGLDSIPAGIGDERGVIADTGRRSTVIPQQFYEETHWLGPVSCRVGRLKAGGELHRKYPWRPGSARHGRASFIHGGSASRWRTHFGTRRRSSPRVMAGEEPAPAKALGHAHKSCSPSHRSEKSLARRGASTIRSIPATGEQEPRWNGRLGHLGICASIKGGCDPRTNGRAQDGLLAPAGW